MAKSEEQEEIKLGAEVLLLMKAVEQEILATIEKLNLMSDQSTENAIKLKFKQDFYHEQLERLDEGSLYAKNFKELITILKAENEKNYDFVNSVETNEKDTIKKEGLEEKIKGSYEYVAMINELLVAETLRLQNPEEELVLEASNSSETQTEASEASTQSLLRQEIEEELKVAVEELAEINASTENRRELEFRLDFYRENLKLLDAGTDLQAENLKELISLLKEGNIQERARVEENKDKISKLLDQEDIADVQKEELRKLERETKEDLDRHAAFYETETTRLQEQESALSELEEQEEVEETDLSETQTEASEEQEEAEASTQSLLRQEIVIELNAAVKELEEIKASTENKADDSIAEIERRVDFYAKLDASPDVLAEYNDLEALISYLKISNKEDFDQLDKNKSKYQQLLGNQQDPDMADYLQKQLQNTEQRIIENKNDDAFFETEATRLQNKEAGQTENQAAEQEQAPAVGLREEQAPAEVKEVVQQQEADGNPVKLDVDPIMEASVGHESAEEEAQAKEPVWQQGVVVDVKPEEPEGSDLDQEDIADVQKEELRKLEKETKEDLKWHAAFYETEATRLQNKEAALSESEEQEEVQETGLSETNTEASQEQKEESDLGPELSDDDIEKIIEEIIGNGSAAAAVEAVEAEPTKGSDVSSELSLDSGYDGDFDNETSTEATSIDGSVQSEEQAQVAVSAQQLLLRQEIEQAFNEANRELYLANEKLKKMPLRDRLASTAPIVRRVDFYYQQLKEFATPRSRFTEAKNLKELIGNLKKENKNNIVRLQKTIKLQNDKSFDNEIDNSRATKEELKRLLKQEQEQDTFYENEVFRLGATQNTLLQEIEAKLEAILEEHSANETNKERPLEEKNERREQLDDSYIFFEKLLETVSNETPKEKNLEELLTAMVAAQEKLHEVHKNALEKLKPQKEKDIWSKLNPTNSDIAHEFEVDTRKTKKDYVKRLSETLEFYQEQLASIKGQDLLTNQEAKPIGAQEPVAEQSVLRQELEKAFNEANKQLYEAYKLSNQHPKAIRKARIAKIANRVDFYLQQLQLLEAGVTNVIKAKNLKELISNLEKDNDQKYAALEKKKTAADKVKYGLRDKIPGLTRQGADSAKKRAEDVDKDLERCLALRAFYEVEKSGLSKTEDTPLELEIKAKMTALGEEHADYSFFEKLLKTVTNETPKEQDLEALLVNMVTAKLYEYNTHNNALQAPQKMKKGASDLLSRINPASSDIAALVERETRGTRREYVEKLLEELNFYQEQLNSIRGVVAVPKPNIALGQELEEQLNLAKGEMARLKESTENLPESYRKEPIAKMARQIDFYQQQLQLFDAGVTDVIKAKNLKELLSNLKKNNEKKRSDLKDNIKNMPYKPWDKIKGLLNNDTADEMKTLEAAKKNLAIRSELDTFYEAEKSRLEAKEAQTTLGSPLLLQEEIKAKLMTIARYAKEDSNRNIPEEEKGKRAKELKDSFDFYENLLEEVTITPPKEQRLEALLAARVAAQEKIVEGHNKSLTPKKKGVFGSVLDKIKKASTSKNRNKQNRKNGAEEQSRKLDMYQKELLKLKSKRPYWKTASTKEPIIREKKFTEREAEDEKKFIALMKSKMVKKIKPTDANLSVSSSTPSKKKTPEESTTISPKEERQALQQEQQERGYPEQKQDSVFSYQNPMHREGIDLANSPSNAPMGMVPTSANDPDRQWEKEISIEIQLINELLVTESELSKENEIQEKLLDLLKLNFDQLDRKQCKLKENIEIYEGNNEPCDSEREEYNNLQKEIRGLKKQIHDLKKVRHPNLEHRMAFYKDQLDKIKKGNPPKEKNLTDLLDREITSAKDKIKQLEEKSTISNGNKAFRRQQKREKFIQAYERMGEFFKEEKNRLKSLQPDFMTSLGVALEHPIYGRNIRQNMELDPNRQGRNFVKLMLRKSDLMLQGQPPQTEEQVKAELIAEKAQNRPKSDLARVSALKKRSSHEQKAHDIQKAKKSDAKVKRRRAM